MPSNAAPPSLPPVADSKIQLRGCCVVRDGRVVLDIPELDVPEGRTIALIGPNGAGKSTLLRMLQLLIRPERGELLLDGAPMQRDPIATRRRMAAAFRSRCCSA